MRQLDKYEGSTREASCLETNKGVKLVHVHDRHTIEGSWGAPAIEELPKRQLCRKPSPNRMSTGDTTVLFFVFWFGLDWLQAHHSELRTEKYEASPSPPVWQGPRLPQGS